MRWNTQHHLLLAPDGSRLHVRVHLFWVMKLLNMHKSHFGNLLMVCAAARSCWCVIIRSSRSFFTVGVLFVLFSFEFLDVPPVGQTTLTSVLSSFSSNTHIIFTTSFNIVSSCIKFTFQSEMDKTTEQSGEEAAPVFFGDACAFFQNKEAAWGFCQVTLVWSTQTQSSRLMPFPSLKF